ncbi:MAG: RtcB family protein [Flavobacteriales bacterium]|nr:MAG: RtcB family protein [Flavobacteriales bacterium]
MKGLKLHGKDLIAIGFPEGRAIGIAINVMLKHHRKTKKEDVLDELKRIAASPDAYSDHEHYAPIADALTGRDRKTEAQHELVARKEYRAYGLEHIEQGAIHQMEVAMKLPVTVAGALMPDAHQGYGLPIGGVLAVENAVIPYGVGVDIGCRMCLSIFNVAPEVLRSHRTDHKRLLSEHTRFGRAVHEKRMDHPVLDRDEFSTIPVVKHLKDRAWSQIGSSGSGNHFVEFGVVEITGANNEFDLAPGSYLALLSHSGSRGLGAGIAQHYTRVAKELCKLPAEAQNLAWLSLDSAAGAEYWAAMNLAGDFASACHHQIHARIAKALGEKPAAVVENHHNFAWKEMHEGREVIVHRKGATPAGKGVLGVIPGSMTAPGYIVRGTGVAESISSASHGAGRLMSRTKAKETIDPKSVKQHLEKHGIELIGGGIDEAPMAYKDIATVMRNQRDLVEVLGSFTPKIVRMCGDGSAAED